MDPAVESVGRGSAIRVLIADDDPVTVAVLEDCLAGWGYTYETVENGDTAWERLSAPDGPAIAILDWLMPGRSGLDICRAVRDTPSLRSRYLIMLTGKGDPGDLEEALDAGADDFMAKPFDEGELRARLGVARRMVELQEVLGHQATQLNRYALYDPLTALPNRTLFEERLERAVQRARRREDYHFAVLFLDIDRFKLINDGFGHAVGDQLLVALADRVRGVLRQVDTIARFAGDEFVILLEELSESYDAAYAVQRIHEALAKPFPVADHDVVLSVSIGLAFDNGEIAQAADLLRHADTAMTHGKADSGSSHVVYRSDMQRSVLHRLRLESDLRRASENDEFRVHFQPIYDLEHRAVVGMEALVRWAVDGGDELLPPGDFLGVAEETDAILELDRWVLGRACAEAARWAAGQGPAPWISVNLSSRQFNQPDLPEVVRATISETGLPANRLCLEITEHTLMASTTQVTETIAALKAMGVRLYLDDFGIGYSSLNILHRLPIDVIKVDRQFVRHLGGPGTVATNGLVRSVIALADNLGLELIAEGIETDAQETTLRKLGCRLGQGYLYSRAVPGRKARALLSG